MGAGYTHLSMGAFAWLIGGQGRGHVSCVSAGSCMKHTQEMHNAMRSAHLLLCCVLCMTQYVTVTQL
jgi:hypothetical protein